MTPNLVDEVKKSFTKEWLIKATAYLDESETGVEKAMTGIVPVVFTMLVNKTFTHEGAGIVAQMAREEQHAGLPVNWENIFDDGNFLQKGTLLLHDIFGSRLHAAMELVSNFSGLTTSSVNALLSITALAVTGIIGKHTTGGASGIANLLNNQKDNIAAAMPGGLNSSEVLGGWNAQTHVGAAPATVINAIPETVENDNGLRILLPLLLLLLSALAVFYLFGKLL